MISPNYVQAMGIPIFKLEHRVGLQLACVGSKSMINYGVKSSIVFRNKHDEEYFNVANINHYNVILLPADTCHYWYRSHCGWFPWSNDHHRWKSAMYLTPRPSPPPWMTQSMNYTTSCLASPCPKRRRQKQLPSLLELYIMHESWLGLRVLYYRSTTMACSWPTLAGKLKASKPS